MIMLARAELWMTTGYCKSRTIMLDLIKAVIFILGNHNVFEFFWSYPSSCVVSGVPDNRRKGKDCVDDEYHQPHGK